MVYRTVPRFVLVSLCLCVLANFSGRSTVQDLMPAEEDSAPMLAGVLAPMPVPVQALAASRVSIRPRLVCRGRSTGLRFHIGARLRLILSEDLVTWFGPTPGFNTFAATRGPPPDRGSGKAQSQEVSAPV